MGLHLGCLGEIVNELTPWLPNLLVDFEVISPFTKLKNGFVNCENLFLVSGCENSVSKCKVASTLTVLDHVVEDHLVCGVVRDPTEGQFVS